MNGRDTDGESSRTLGPRNGRTTVNPTGTMVRKSFWIDRDVEERLRREAFESRRTEAEIVRGLLREHFGLD